MRIERIALGSYVTEIFKEQQYFFLISYQGLKVAELNQLRNKLSKAGASCQVLKNTYIRLGLLNNGFTIPASWKLGGDTAVVYGTQYPCPVAKELKAFGKTNDKVVVKGGMIDGQLLSGADAVSIADLPSKQQLQAQLLGLLLATPTNLVRVLNAKVASIVNVIQAYHDKLDQAS
jgi:large subunit ribosomal protein L10